MNALGSRTRCQILSNPKNGRVEHGGTDIDSVATYSCQSGYVLDGLSQRRCASDGTWSGTDPTCKPIYLSLNLRNRVDHIYLPIFNTKYFSQ